MNHRKRKVVRCAITKTLRAEGYLLPGDTFEFTPDPQVDDCYAVRVTTEIDSASIPAFDLLLTTACDLGRLWDVDEVEFACWPPTNGRLKFFI